MDRDFCRPIKTSSCFRSCHRDLYDDYFGVIANIGEIMTKMGQEGLAGLVALALLVSWYKK